MLIKKVIVENTSNSLTKSLAISIKLILGRTTLSHYMIPPLPESTNANSLQFPGAVPSLAPKPPLIPHSTTAEAELVGWEENRQKERDPPNNRVHIHNTPRAIHERSIPWPLESYHRPASSSLLPFWLQHELAFSSDDKLPCQSSSCLRIL